MSKSRFFLISLILLFIVTLALVQLYDYNATLFGVTLAVLLILLSLVIFILPLGGNDRYPSTELMAIDSLSQYEFNLLLMPIFQRQGYSVNKMKKQKRGLADLILRKKGTKAIVYAKKTTTMIDDSYLKQALATKPLFQATKLIVVTNRFFTKDAKSFARANKIILIDRDSLDALLEAYIRQKHSHRFIFRVRSLFIKPEV